MAYKEDLINQIFASELDYLEIKKRADAISALSEIMPDQQRILDDYNKKLSHDRETITIWINKLNADFKVTKLDMITRQAVLDKLILDEQQAKAEVNTLIAINDSKIIAKEISQVDYDSDIADLTKRIASRDNRISILDELKAMTKAVWE